MQSRDRETGWRTDNLGVMAPIGSGASWKEFLRASRRQGAEVANIAARGRLSDGWLEFMTATSIATYRDEKGNYKIDDEHEIFMANIIGGSIGQDGRGRDEALMAQVGVVAPAALSGMANKRDGRDGQNKTQPDRRDRQVNEDSE